MSVPSDYGSRYWAITGEGDDLYLHADRLEILPCGSLVAWGGFYNDDGELARKEQILFCLAAGQWQTFYAASMLDGRAVCVEPDA